MASLLIEFEVERLGIAQILFEEFKDWELSVMSKY
jgi:hypothetical protein